MDQPPRQPSWLASDQNNESANPALSSKTHQVDNQIGLQTLGPDRLDPKEFSPGR